MATRTQTKPAKNQAGAKAKGKKQGTQKDRPGAEPGTSVYSVATHPRAGVQVRRAKGWGGLLGFVLAFYLSLQAAVPIADAGERALIAGAIGYLLGWGCSLVVWRHLMMAELRASAEQVVQRRSDAAAQSGE